MHTSPLPVSPWADGDVLGLLCQCVGAQLSHDLHWPGGSLPDDLGGSWHVNDDLLLCGLGLLLDLVQVQAANIADPASHVQEAKGGDLQTGRGKQPNNTSAGE